MKYDNSGTVTPQMVADMVKAVAEAKPQPAATEIVIIFTDGEETPQ